MFYGAYGSNLHPDRLRRRVPSAIPKGIVELCGWSLKFHKRGQDGSAKCNIIKSATFQEKLYLAIYEMNPSGKCRLDHIEGLGQGYEEQNLFLEGFGTVFFYVANSNFIDASLQPFTWYRDLVVRGCQYHQFPLEYINTVQRHPAIDDFDQERQDCNINLVLSLSV